MCYACRLAVVGARESTAWEAGANRVRLRDCKGSEVGKVLQDRRKLKSVRAVITFAAAAAFIHVLPVLLPVLSLCCQCESSLTWSC